MRAGGGAQEEKDEEEAWADTAVSLHLQQRWR